MMLRTYIVVLATLCWLAGSLARAQSTVVAHVDVSNAKQRTPPTVAAMWLEPISANLQGVAWPAHDAYRLVQKARTFSPHVLVVPVGATVAFPNADPYFHNVFSLFDGSRFDLGLYEAGRTRNVHFSRLGVSYIFCNIHPEMGAVVLSLDTPLWAISSNANELVVRNVPKGSYEVHLWVEGQSEALLKRWSHFVTVASNDTVDAGVFHAQTAKPVEHTDKFGHEYKKAAEPY